MDTPHETIDTQLKNWLHTQPNISKELWEELVYLRNRPLKKGKYEKQLRLDKPVATFSKDERLKEGMGKEITLIFRSSACSWAKSQSGGCTMCGYWNDRAPESITGENYWAQFESTLDKYQDLLSNPQEKIVFKMFTSGSFSDPKEIPKDIQFRILDKLNTFDSIKEIVIESRPEYITDSILQEYKKRLSEKYLEFGVGLESSNDFVRQNIINKGFTWDHFLKVTHLLHSYGFGMKAYLLFKPPFVNEYSAIQDCYRSIRDCIENKVDTISINPTNIQMHTLCAELEQIHAFSPPWLYSLLYLIKKSISNEELKSTRMICDPSAAGKDRGVHNGNPKDPSNEHGLEILHHFVNSQDVSVIPDFYKDNEWNEYMFELFLGNA